MTSLPTTYQQFIHISRYARWLDDKQRRETWEETVSRYCDFFSKRFDGKYDDVIYSELKPAILNVEVLPSLRGLMTAGHALERENIAGYNCAYIAVSSKRNFSEILYILMNGTGCGFSCERQEVVNLPTIPDKLTKNGDVIVVEDSKLGWAKAYNKLINSLYDGDIPDFDYSKIRPAGARLKTFGGRASGPKPLKKLFEFTIEAFKKSAGRKLQSIEVHDIVCTIAETIVVGGVRRSALISLSNLSDQRMRDAKSGQWWLDHPERALANNSIAYTEKPEPEIFMEEWLALVKSKSGERGIFNRVSAQKQAAKWGKRDPSLAYGVNPCCFTGDMQLLTAEGYKTFSELSGKSVSIVSSDGTITEGSVWSSGVKETVRVTFEGVSKEITCTPDHIFMLEDGYECQADDLVGKFVKSYDLNTTYKVLSVSYNGKHEVFDFTEPKNHWGVVEGVVVHNSEIILRPTGQMCNLSTIIVRAEDDKESLKKKSRLATILGTFQASLTDFHFIGENWKRNTTEEALLGVSLCGIMDNYVLSGQGSKETLKEWLNEIRDYTVEVNAEWSGNLGINPSAAICCVKPEGTSSQMVDAASGIHTRHSKYYLRTVRSDKKDPLYHFMQAKGIYCEDDVTKPETGAVFYFPIKATDDCLTRDSMTALDQLDIWLFYQNEWCHHKPSVTISVSDNEWVEVGAWVWKHFDEISGVSFLPKSNHTYAQAPYQEVTKEEYEKWVSEHPIPEIDWSELSEFEKEDATTGTQQYACSSGYCELV